jgi:O-methyltransferase
MKNTLREIALKIAGLGLPKIKTIEKILSLMVMRRVFDGIFSSPRYKSREEMWEKEIASFAETKNIVYLEFGVWEGYSIIHLANKFNNPDHKFYGFDSFQGLPESWDTLSGVINTGHFSTKGNTPQIDDSRVEFIQGWFQNSVDSFITQLTLDKSRLVVHYDADLYSSTLYCLMQVDRLKTQYLAFFDEIPGHETRALYNYMQATGAHLRFLGRVGPSKNYPSQVAAIISPCTEYVVT